MKTFLIIGMGRFGRHAARKLFELGHEVMAVDEREDCISEALPYTTRGLIGNGTSEAFIESIGVNNFDACIVAIGDDFQSSLEATSLLKEHGAKLVIARAARSVHAKFLLRNGADHVVYPEKQLAEWTAIRYSSDHIIDYIELDKEYNMIEVPVPEQWNRKSIGQLDIRKHFGINIIAIRTGGRLRMNIMADTELSDEDTLLVIGRYEDIRRCFHL